MPPLGQTVTLLSKLYVQVAFAALRRRGMQAEERRHGWRVRTAMCKVLEAEY